MRRYPVWLPAIFGCMIFFLSITARMCKGLDGAGAAASLAAGASSDNRWESIDPAKRYQLRGTFGCFELRDATRLQSMVAGDDRDGKKNLLRRKRRLEIKGGPVFIEKAICLIKTGCWVRVHPAGATLSVWVPVSCIEGHRNWNFDEIKGGKGFGAAYR